jgi:Tfp pilus assembly protein PilX
MNRIREDDGIALVSAIIMLVVFLGLGFGMLAYADSQQKASANEQQSEGAYALAEAALNAQIFELSVQWPTSALNAQANYPASCTAASAGAGYCPDPTYLSSAYPVGSSANCPASTSGDAWATGPVTNGWTTYVRDAGPTSGTQQLFSSSVEKTMAPYDASLDSSVWVRAAATVNCHTAVVLSKVSAQYVGLSFPHNVLDANGFETDNSGNGSGPIINAQGDAPQPSQIDVRCNGLGNQIGAGSQCTNYATDEQVSPPNDIAYTPNASAQTLSAQQLLSMEAQAKANGTYWGPGQCPSSMSQLTGTPTYVAGPCTLDFEGNDQANPPPTSPGFLVLANGTIKLGGTVTFYGVVYGVNQQASSGNVVTITANAVVSGGVVVDGNGTVDAGDSHKGNLSYDPKAVSSAKTWGGAQATPNSFRQLPAGQ